MSTRPVVSIAAFVGLALLLPSATAAAKSGGKTKKKGTALAVSYFDNNSGDPTLDALKKGLADMLITDLSGLPGLDLVERRRLEDIVKELELQKSKLVDKKTAVKMGKLLAAKYLLVGSYTVDKKGKMRVDARLLAVKSGKVAASHKVEGKTDDFFAIEKELAELVVDTLQIKLDFKAKTKLRRNATQSYSAFLAYSQGLDASDRGDYERAKAMFQKALDADPQYKAAKSARERFSVAMAKHDQARAKGVKALLAKLDPKSKTYASDFAVLMAQLDETDPNQYRQMLELLITLIKKDQLPLQKTPMGVTSPLVDQIMRILSFYVADPASTQLLFGTCEWAIKTAPGSQIASGMCKSYKMQIDQLNKVYNATKNPNGMAKDWAEAKRKAPEVMKAKYTHYELGRKLMKLCAKYAKKG